MPQVGALGHLDAHQQPAVGAARDAEAAGAGDLPRDQVLADGREVVIGDLPLRLQRRLVPCRAELAAAADIGDRECAAAFHPQFAGDGAVAGHVRHLEAAVCGQDRRRRAVQLHTLPVRDEIRDLRAVLRRRLELLGDEVRRVELGRHRLDLRDLVAVGLPQGRRRDVAGDAEEGVLAVRVAGDEVDGGIVGQRQTFCRPLAAAGAGSSRRGRGHCRRSPRSPPIWSR